VRRGGLCAKQMGLKQGVIGNILWEHIRNLMGTIRNLKRTCWEQRKNEKKIPPHSPTQNLKENKNQGSLSAC
jgi:hypothetical protein